MANENQSGYYLLIRALGEPRRVAITASRYAEIKTAWANLKHIVNIEEEWSSLIQNYVDLEKGLLDAAVDHMVYSVSDYHEYQDARLSFSVRLANLLSTCKSYLDHVPHHLNSLSPKAGEKEAFKKMTNIEFDSRPSYRLMEALRNYAQHRGSPLHGASYGSRSVGGEDSSLMSFSVATQIDVEMLRADPVFKRAVLEGISETTIPVEPHVRNYIEGIGAIHVAVRDLVADRVSEWMKVVRDAIKDFQEGADRQKILGLSIADLADDGTWKESVPIVGQMLERIDLLRRRNRTMVNLTRRFVTSSSNK